MAQGITTGEKYWEDRVAFETEGAGQEHVEYDDVLAFNTFDGLPYSSRYYTLLKERMDLPVWKARCDFMDKLANRQFIIVSGTARTGRSSQVS